MMDEEDNLPPTTFNQGGVGGGGAPIGPPSLTKGWFHIPEAQPPCFSPKMIIRPRPSLGRIGLERKIWKI